MCVDVNPRYVALDPKRGGALAVLEAARNLTCVGAKPLAITDCLNFASPERPEVMWSFAESIQGIAEACQALGTPVVSGNVSFYNETEGRPILPTPTVGMVGVVDDVDKVTTMAFKSAGARLILLGSLGDRSFGGSELLIMETGSLSGQPAEPDLIGATRVHAAALDAIRGGLVESAHDASEGGLGVLLAECAIAGKLGAKVRLPNAGSEPVRALFGEGPNVIVLSVRPERAGEVLEIARRRGAPAADIGEVTGPNGRLEIEGWLDVPVEKLEDAWTHGLLRAFGSDGAEARRSQVEG
jgi:phosphoribosylformylglycinamidine synthase